MIFFLLNVQLSDTFLTHWCNFCPVLLTLDRFYRAKHELLLFQREISSFCCCAFKSNVWRSHPESLKSSVSIAEWLRLAGYHLVWSHSQAGPSTAASPGLCSDGFSITLRSWDSAISLSILCDWSPSQQRKYFLMFRQNLLYFGVCLLSLVLSLGATGKSLALSPLLPLLQVFIYVDKTHPPELSSLGWSPKSLSLSSCERCSSTIIIFMSLC